MFFSLFFKSYTCDFVKGLKLNLSFCVGRFLKKSNLREKQHIEIVGQLYAHIIPVVPWANAELPLVQVLQLEL